MIGENHSPWGLIILAGLLSLMQLPSATPSIAASSDANVSIAGFAFVGSGVTAQGRRANLPPGTKIYPPGSKIPGPAACQTNRSHSDGSIVAVIHYQAQPIPGSVQVTRHPARGGEY